jgi:hypothetical protein
VTRYDWQVQKKKKKTKNPANYNNLATYSSLQCDKAKHVQCYLGFAEARSSRDCWPACLDLILSKGIGITKVLVIVISSFFPFLFSNDELFWSKR